MKIDIKQAFYRTRNIIRIKIPFLSVFARIMEEHNLVRKDELNTHGTDGKRYYYSEKFSEKLPPREFMFINMHEIYHVLFQHHIRGYNKNHRVYNLAADIKINSHLYLERGEYLRTTDGLLNYSIPKDALLPRENGKPCPHLMLELVKMSTEQIYLELLDKTNKKAGSNVNFYGNSIKVGQDVKLDIILPPRTEQEQREAGRKAEIDLNMARELGKSAGNNPGFLQNIAASLTKVRIKWYKTFERRLRQMTAGESSLNSPKRWTVQSRQYLPGEEKNEYSQQNVYVGIDTSGSISDSDLRGFFSILTRLSKKYRVEDNCFLNGWDTDVSERYCLKNAIEIMKSSRAFKFSRGGTNVNCYFEYLNSQKKPPDLIMILTDGEFYEKKYSLKKSLQSKVLWVLTGDYDKDIKEIGYGKIVYV